ncbi:MAG: hypothetical protein HC802_14005, partial [Caldilineaceae bacterium]|nr:hypothetical protein [Caldilineaceae bacterium]
MQATRSNNPDAQRVRRTSLDLVAIFLGLVLIGLVIALFSWQFWHANRIFTGVTVAGVPVGGLTRAAALERLTRRIPIYPLPPTTLYHEDEQWPITANQVRLQGDLLQAVNQAYLVGRRGDFSERIAEQSQTALLGRSITPPLTFDLPQLRHTVERIAREAQRSPRPSSQVGEVMIAAQAGLEVNIDATVDALVQAIQSEGDVQTVAVPLQATILPPPADPVVVVEDAAAALATPQPLLLRDELFGLELAVDVATLSALTVEDSPLRLDEEKLRGYLTVLAEQIAVPSRDARLRFNPDTGGVSVLQSSQAGRRLDIDATITAMQTAVANNASQAALVVAELSPAVDMHRIGEMGIRELVASGTTTFAGSSAARVRNIEVAAEKFDGVVIPPDGVFSFNDVVKDVSSANSFEDSLIIWGDRTAVGVGGGVCQVSTTVFRAAYQAGLPIVERYNHGYVVDWYGEPGMDATIFTPTVDFRFRNDTGAYLLVEPSVNAANGTITFNLYGTKPDREVLIAAPVQKEILDPPEPAYQVDETLASGQQNRSNGPRRHD